MRRVVVTGLGPISPIATGKDAYWKALREGRNGVGPITTFELGDCPVTFGGKVEAIAMVTVRMTPLTIQGKTVHRRQIGRASCRERV